MPTRLYLPSTGAAPISPSFGSWGQTTSADRIAAVTSRISSAMTAKATAVSSSIQTVLNRQYVYGPIAAGTISGTVKGQLRGWESAAAMDAVSAFTARVVDSGGSLRGTLLAITAPALSGNEYVAGGTNPTNRFTPTSTAISSVDAVNGDYLVIEIGISQLATSTNRYVDQYFGDDNASDLAENQTAVALHNPWIEFSATISPYTPTFLSAWARGANALIGGL
jgi:hypothetical protein